MQVFTKTVSSFIYLIIFINWFIAIHLISGLLHGENRMAPVWFLCGLCHGRFSYLKRNTLLKFVNCMIQNLCLQLWTLYLISERTMFKYLAWLQICQFLSHYLFLSLVFFFFFMLSSSGTHIYIHIQYSHSFVHSKILEHLPCVWQCDINVAYSMVNPLYIGS